MQFSVAIPYTNLAKGVLFRLLLLRDFRRPLDLDEQLAYIYSLHSVENILLRILRYCTLIVPSARAQPSYLVAC